MRLFLSCNVPQEISDYVHELTKKLPAAKLSVPKNIDLTIKFFGDVPDDTLDEIKKRLNQLRFRPFTAVLDGIGVFSEDFLRVVWVGLKPGEKFEELHVQADELLSPLLPKEKRFKPHLTLARIKLVGNKKQFLEALAKIRVEQKTFVVKKLVLFRSKLSPKGAVHEPVMEVLAQDL